MQREVRREMEKMEETPKPSTLAQDYMREEIEKKKKEKKNISAEKQARKDEQFSLKQEKRKEKHCGHCTKRQTPLEDGPPRFAISRKAYL
ncbi:DUF2992 family protein [Candidatus Protochlamydia amoebophila]|uniref:DUF2992 family protein n=1 Tax=Candidatus Protochlamydia amoebophila TaxID=362787 RepID=UPI002A4E1A74|nr:DUF2992 family protein [Candidatus Protochlamydia amoebophila]